MPIHQERKLRTTAVTSRRLSTLLNADDSERQRISALEADGRELAKVHGFKSAPVRSKAVEIDAIVDRRNRIGVLIERLRARHGA